MRDQQRPRDTCRDQLWFKIHTLLLLYILVLLHQVTTVIMQAGHLSMNIQRISDFGRPPPELGAPVLAAISTPLVTDAWEVMLTSHPDRAFARYICSGIRSGFRIGFRRGSPLRSATANMPSAQRAP
jgi:hypothetical protein